MQHHRWTLTRDRLDGTVLDIEFLLIAVIQGLALTTLAVESEGMIVEVDWLFWPYMVSGFILIINFWTLALVHSISFIRWPFDVVHTLFYLLVAFVEVAAFAQITHPAKWFAFTFAFFVVSALLYLWDMKMIRDRRDDFADTPAKQALYRHIHDRQLNELRLVVPAALIFQGGVVAVLWLRPEAILGGHRDLILVLAQIVFGVVYLADTIRAFGVRRELITACIEEPAKG
jgi:hypothetical protein